MKIKFIFALVVVFWAVGNADGQSALSKATYTAYVTGDKEKAEKLVLDQQADHKTLAQLEAHYVLLNSTMAEEDKETFHKHVKSAEKIAETIMEKSGEDQAKAGAILSAIYGLKIAYSPMKGMFLGSKSQKLFAEALAIAPEDPMVLALYGISQYNTPETWGGSMDRASSSLTKAVEIMECNADAYDHSWVYAHAQAWLGMVQMELGRLEAATATYQKAMEKHPDFSWVKYVLLPELQEGLAKNNN